MSLMVSYLVISRLSNSLNRYMDARMYLSDLMRTSRELIQQTVAFTRYDADENSNNTNAMKWRVDVAKRTISLLKAMVNYLRYPSSKKNVWENNGLTDLEKKAVVWAVGSSNERAPFVLNIFLRSVIASHVKKLNKPLEVVQELVLLGFTSGMIEAYTKIIKDMNTPYPFPLVQMTRTFLFLWVFSLPLALSNDIEKLCPLVFVTFILTYGFLGLELISIEMDDPYGTDPNDFNVEFLADVVYSDIHVYIEDIDGSEAVDKVKRAMKKTEQSYKYHPAEDKSSDSNEEDEDGAQSYIRSPIGSPKSRKWRNLFKNAKDKMVNQMKTSSFAAFSTAPKKEVETSGPENEPLLNETQSSPSRKLQFACGNYDRRALQLDPPLPLSLNKRRESLDISGTLVNGAAAMDSDSSIDVLSPSSLDVSERNTYKLKKQDDGEMSLRRQSRSRDSEFGRLSTITDQSITASASGVSVVSKESHNSSSGSDVYAKKSYYVPTVDNRSSLSSSFLASEIVQISSRTLIGESDDTDNGNNINDDDISYCTSRDIDDEENDDDGDDAYDGISAGSSDSSKLDFLASSSKNGIDNDSNISCASNTVDS